MRRSPASLPSRRRHRGEERGVEPLFPDREPLRMSERLMPESLDRLTASLDDATPPDPYARLSLHDRLELLAFEARLAGFPESLIQAV